MSSTLTLAPNRTPPGRFHPPRATREPLRYREWLGREQLVEVRAIVARFEGLTQPSGDALLAELKRVLG